MGEVPLITSTDAQTTSLAKRESVANVYKQIISDLQEAQTSLPANFIYSDRVRANKIAATALLARVYLYLQKWPEAVAQSTQVIQLSSIVMLEPLNKVFIKNSNETILQFWRQNGFSNAGLFYIPSSGNIPGYPVTPFLISSFEANDQRKTAWITTTTQQGTVYPYPYKYKKRSANSSNDAEYAMTLRLAEQYLIRAEAHAKQNNLIEAIADLNRIRNRAGLAPLSSSFSQSQLLPIIEKERLTELFSEWGHRFFDLKRNGRLDLVLSNIKPQWKPFAAVLPVPQQEINKNPFLVQNTGY